MVREVLVYPDPRLKQKSVPVPVVDEDVRTLVRDMADTMYAEDGIGLAAPQIGVLWRILVIDIDPGGPASRLQTFINPEFVRTDGKTRYKEGCLSVPGEAEDVERFSKVRVRALDEQGHPFELDADGLLAIALQHEMDHLEGVLFVDRISTLKRGLIRKRMEKYRARRPATPSASV